MTAGSRWSGRWPWVAAFLLLVVPLAEIAVIIAVGKVIGGWPTLGLLLVESAIGAWLVKREGRATWLALREALRTGRMPAGELSDAALVLVGGTLLLTPGFLSDVLGFACVLPGTRGVARRALTAVVTRKLLAESPVARAFSTFPRGGATRQTPPAGAPSGRPSGSPSGPAYRPTDPDDDIIEGEIL